MADYASAVRKGTLAAARLHRDLGTEARVKHASGGDVDVFDAVARLKIPLLLRPLKGADRTKPVGAARPIAQEGKSAFAGRGRDHVVSCGLQMLGRQLPTHRV